MPIEVCCEQKHNAILVLILNGVNRGLQGDKERDIVMMWFYARLLAELGDLLNFHCSSEVTFTSWLDLNDVSNADDILPRRCQGAKNEMGPWKRGFPLEACS